jgi:hypothetical protein
VPEAALVTVPSVEILRRLAECDLLLDRREFGLHHRRNLLGHRVLDDIVFSDHSCDPSSVETSSAVMRTRRPIFRTLPLTT